MFLKNLLAPIDNKTKEVETVQLWYVRWTARHGEYSSSTKEVMEAFTSEAEAEGFKKSLKLAFDLVRQTCQTDVYISKN
jgi:hypothetical protein